MPKTPIALLCALFLSILLAPRAEAGAVILEGGDVLHGIVHDEGEQVIVEHAVLGRLVLPRARVVEVHPDDGAIAPGADVVLVAGNACPPCPPCPPPCDPCPPDPCADPCEPDPCDPCKSPWSFELGAAVSQATGNSELFDVQLDGLLKYARGRNTFEAALAYVYGEQDGDRTAENWHGKARFERKFTSRAYYFLQTLYDRDDFADLQHRITVLGGIGAELLHTRYSVFKAEIGGGATFERRFGEDWQNDPSAYAGLDYTYEHPSGRRLALELDFLPNLDDFDLSRTIFHARFDQPLCDELSLSLGLRMEHVVDPPGDVEELDTLFTAGLRLRL